MSRIRMPGSKSGATERTFQEVFREFVVDATARGLSNNSISSYTRVVGAFLNWCDKLGYCHVEMPKYRQQGTIKGTYTDEELKRLLKPPEKTCRFSVYRTWVIINFLLNSGCRAATGRNILIGDVDLGQRQVFFRHTKNRKVQIRFTNDLLDTVIDRFGANDAFYTPTDDNHFTISAEVEVSNMFYSWVCSFRKKATIVGPPEVVEGFQRFLNDIRGRYE